MKKAYYPNTFNIFKGLQAVQRCKKDGEGHYPGGRKIGILFSLEVDWSLTGESLLIGFKRFHM